MVVKAPPYLELTGSLPLYGWHVRWKWKLSLDQIFAVSSAMRQVVLGNVSGIREAICLFSASGNVCVNLSSLKITWAVWCQHRKHTLVCTGCCETWALWASSSKDEGVRRCWENFPLGSKNVKKKEMMWLTADGIEVVSELPAVVVRSLCGVV